MLGHPAAVHHGLLRPGTVGHAALHQVRQRGINSVNGAIRTLAAEQNVLLADFHYSFTYQGTQSGWFSGDGLHLSEAGYQRMAELIRNLMVLNYETIAPPVP